MKSLALSDSVSSRPEDETLSCHDGQPLLLQLPTFPERKPEAPLTPAAQQNMNSVPYENLPGSYNVSEEVRNCTIDMNAHALSTKTFLLTLNAVNNTIPRRLGKLKSCV
ncbi:hypothetical protein AGDE_17144 [Angomonas deanei]|uniref:Uncharacterized protein n=1 Tax=Angomonas deanei TaxID=59799 RepID=A0A7G2C7K7_9TRYP|nr:hypothetical protein AGDE_17144 [Angomonas deanei]CAD2213962.1 hypothetical protein, conserved [Angomonas deanei]|eukprot:EPY15376.1 hypothetical protein AGDE_17144 [Angomonas deanei]